MPRTLATAAVLLFVATPLTLGACKRSEEPRADPLKTQRDAMEKAKDVGKTMQKGVDAEGKKADEDGK